MHSLRALLRLRTRQLLPNNPARAVTSATATASSKPSASAPEQERPRKVPNEESEACVLEAASCFGFDGRAPVEEGEDDDYEEYFREHKPSPLSGLEVVDTRKPINRWAAAAAGGYEGRGMMVEETLDETLARAEAMFREAAARGDPTLPHSRALARLLRQRQERSF